MSKAVKSIVSVVAMIAIPYFAPIIASSAALAGASAAIGMTATSALVGAGLGAVKGLALGEDIGRSALMGGIGGGVSGYLQAPTSAVPQSALTAANATADPIAALNASQGFTGVDQAYLASMTPMDQIAVMNAQQGYTAADPTYTAQAAQTPASAGLDTSGLSGAMPVPTTQLPTPGAAPVTGTAGTAGTAGTTAAPRTFSEALSQTGAAIKAKFTDPKNLADLTLRAAGQLAGSALAGSGLSSEEEALLAQQTEELRNLQQTNQALFNQRLEQAQNLIGESKYFDPEYFGLQSARRAQTAGAVAKRAGLRGLTGDRRESEARRFDIESGRRTGTAYDTGFQSAVSPRLQTMQAGMQMMPTAYPSSMDEYTNLRGAYTTADRSRQREVGGVQRLFGSLTETPQASSRGR
jgi:hypothetical protein